MEFDFNSHLDSSTFGADTIISFNSPLTPASDFFDNHISDEPSWFVSDDDSLPFGDLKFPDTFGIGDGSIFEVSDYLSFQSEPNYGLSDPHTFARTNLKPCSNSTPSLFRGIPSQHPDEVIDNEKLSKNHYNKMFDDLESALKHNPALLLLTQNSSKKRLCSESLEEDNQPSSRPRLGSTDSQEASTKLRTATRKSKMSVAKTTADKPTVSDKVQQSRVSHNIVEKQYRNRLNQQFELLLAVLPTPVEGVDDCDGASIGNKNHKDGNSRRLSKGDVLEMARRRIKVLERENKLLVAGREDIKRINMGSLETELGL